MNRFFFMDEINLWLIDDIIKWLVIYMKRDWRQLYINFILIIILYCLLNTVNTSQIPLNQQLHIPEQLKVYLYN